MMMTLSRSRHRPCVWRTKAMRARISHDNRATATAVTDLAISCGLVLIPKNTQLTRYLI